MRKFIVPALLGLLVVAVIAIGAYAALSISGVNTDLEDARAEVASLKANAKRDFRTVRADLRSVESDISGLQEEANAQQEKANLAADNKKAVERDITKQRLIDLQKDFQVTGWKVSCVVATSNTLSCLGEGFLDGQDSKESYDATVDQTGSFVWKQTY